MGTWLASPKGACTKAEPKPQQAGATCPHHVSVCLVALQRPSGFAKREVRLSRRASRLSKIPPEPRGEGRWRISRCEDMASSQPCSREAAQHMAVRARHIQGLLHGPCTAPWTVHLEHVRPCSRAPVWAAAPGALLVANFLFVALQGQGWPLPHGTASSKWAMARAESDAWQAGSGTSLAARGCPHAAFGGSGRWLRFQLSNPQRAPIFHFISLAAGAAAGLTARAMASPASQHTVACFPARCGARGRSPPPRDEGMRGPQHRKH